MMLKRTLLLSVIVAAVAALLFCGTSLSVAAEKEVSFQADNAMFLGQDAAQRNPTIGERFRSMFSKILSDPDEETSRTPDRRSVPVVVQPAVPTQPPKPLTAAEVQQSAAAAATTAAPQRRTTTTTPSRQGTSDRATPTPTPVPTESANNVNEEEVTTEDSLFNRMDKYRQKVLANPALEEAALASRQLSTTPELKPSPSPLESGNAPNSIIEQTPVPSISVASEAKPENNPVSALVSLPQAAAENPQPIPPRETVVIDHVPAVQPSLAQNPIQNPVSVSPLEAAPPSVSVEPTPSQEPLRNKQLVVSESPRFGIEIEKPQVSAVGQEVTYRIRFSNTGNVPIEQIIVTTEIPSWIDVRHVETNNGKAEAIPRDDGSGISDLSWKISRVEPSTTDLLILRLVPQQRRSIELVFNCDYYRPAIVAKVEVQEPKLEMELLGADEVLWNELVTYTLLVRNVGNGGAENLKLTLLQTNSDAAQCEFEEPLLPGEEQPIPISVQAGKEQEFIEIAVQVTGAHDLTGEIKRRIRVLRPKLEMSVQTPAFHFVENPAVFTIRVRNMGTADAENMTVRAELPLGAQYDSSSEGGMLTTQEQQSVVEWRGTTIMQGETQTYMLTCLPKREGECRVSVVACAPGGTVLASGNSTFTAEAISELDLMVLKPKGHVELGQEAEYTIQVTNIGTKAAENVEVSMAFGWKEGSEAVAVLEPINVAGGEASLYNGMVTFEKIPVIPPKQTVELKVIAKAEQAGTVPIKTQVNGKDISGLVGNELSTTVFSRQSKVATATDSSQNEVK